MKTIFAKPRNSYDWVTWITLLLVSLILLVSESAQAVATGKLSALTVNNLTPAFDPNVTAYTIPKTASCSAQVSATAAGADANTQFYIANNPVAGGSGTVGAWYCNSSGKIEIVIYQSWSQKGKYTITPVEQAPPPSPPPAISGKLTGLVAANLSPAFDPNVTQYTVPMPTNCSVPITATVLATEAANSNFKLYIGNSPATSGTPLNAYVCGSSATVDVVIYNVWNEVGHYKITASGTPPVSGGGSSNGGSSGGSSGGTIVTDPPQEQIPSGPQPQLALPTASPVDKATAVRFLEQATFGPTQAEVAAVMADGPALWMAKQYNLPPTQLPTGLDANHILSQGFSNMANAQDQLRQRMMFALSQLFVVSQDKNINGEELEPWVQLLSRNAFGNFRQLLKEVTFSPTMGKYLDLANSMKATASTSPNENYAREVMQLFTIGLKQLKQDGSLKLDGQGQPIPTYDQNSLREVARALTGLTYPTAPDKTPQSNNWEYFVGLMEYRQANHDTGKKTLPDGQVLPAGQTVKQDFDAMLDWLFKHPNTAPFVAQRLIEHFVTSNPSAAYIQRVADKFADNGSGVRGDLWAVLTAVLTDTEALAANSATRGHLKDPVLHVLNLSRALGAQVNDPSQFMYVFRSLGEAYLDSPTVFNFYSPMAPLPGFPGQLGPEFQIYSPGLAIQRSNFIYQILSGQMGSALVVDLSPFKALANDPAGLVELVNQRLLFGRMSNQLRQILLTEANNDPYDRVFGVLYLTALSTEFSVQQ